MSLLTLHGGRAAHGQQSKLRTEPGHTPAGPQAALTLGINAASLCLGLPISGREEEPAEQARSTQSGGHRALPSPPKHEKQASEQTPQQLD